MDRSTAILGLGLVALMAGAASAAPFTYAAKTRYADVAFSWSAEAGMVPALVRRFRAQLATAKARTAKCGHEESAIRIRTGGEAIACSSSTKITTSGQTGRLLSLARSDWAFTGGAHGNGGTSALLWDRKRGRRIAFGDLFRSTDGYPPAFRTAYCRALELERAKRRGPDYPPSTIPEFARCPAWAELALIPASARHRGRFDTIHLIAAPYTAGPYVEGEYDIAVPSTRALVAALKPEYRGSFAAQPQ
ncbi:MAG: hypothetical protein ABIW33_04680 [Sphingomicrobium sp.]